MYACVCIMADGTTIDEASAGMNKARRHVSKCRKRVLKRARVQVRAQLLRWGCRGGRLLFSWRYGKPHMTFYPPGVP